MGQGRLGDRLFHGDAEAQEQLGVKLSNTGMACAMCHPMAADTHPHEFPKYQEQMQAFATLRDMTNWCIEKPNQGEKIDLNSEAMKRSEAHTSELQSLMRISYAVFRMTTQNNKHPTTYANCRSRTIHTNKK